MSDKQPKRNVTFRLDAEIIDGLDDLAERLGVTRTEALEKCVTSGLREGRKMAKRLENPFIRAFVEAAVTMDEDLADDEREQLGQILEHIRGKRGKKVRAAT